MFLTKYSEVSDFKCSIFTLKITNLWTWLFSYPTHFVWNIFKTWGKLPFPKFIKTGKLDKDSNNLLKWNLTGKDPFNFWELHYILPGNWRMSSPVFTKSSAEESAFRNTRVSCYFWGVPQQKLCFQSKKKKVFFLVLFQNPANLRGWKCWFCAVSPQGQARHLRNTCDTGVLRHRLSRKFKFSRKTMEYALSPSTVGCNTTVYIVYLSTIQTKFKLQ